MFCLQVLLASLADKELPTLSLHCASSVCLVGPSHQPLCPMGEPSLLGLALTWLLWSCLAVLNLSGSQTPLGNREKIFIHPFNCVLGAGLPSRDSQLGEGADSNKNPNQTQGSCMSASAQGQDRAWRGRSGTSEDIEGMRREHGERYCVGSSRPFKRLWMLFRVKQGALGRFEQRRNVLCLLRLLRADTL